jgi:hypothetical protein
MKMSETTVDKWIKFLFIGLSGRTEWVIDNMPNINQIFVLNQFGQIFTRLRNERVRRKKMFVCLVFVES